jgi:hypothetical protein
MSYRELIYKNAFEIVNVIYKDSKYDPDQDLFRASDILNSINENQWASKEWLVDTLMPFLDYTDYDVDADKVCIMGSWYGLLSYLLRQKVPDEVELWNIDIDRLAPKYGQLLLGHQENIIWHCDNASDWFFDMAHSFGVIINTSCEHMEQEDIHLMRELKRPDALMCMQSNNYHHVQSHINTHNSLDEFVDSLDLYKVLHKEELEAPNKNYNRYMVIGK